jgi:chromosome partitioning protein
MNSGIRDLQQLPIPAVFVREAWKRPRPGAHVIVFANEKGGVGKSTLSFHCAVGLVHSGARVLAIDADSRQRSLSQTLDLRSGTATALKADLPCPRHVVLDQQGSAHLCQEMLRLGSDADFIVIDLPGFDSVTARAAMSIANTLVTPVGNSTFDIMALGKLDPVTRALVAPGYFSTLVGAIRKERSTFDPAPLDWLVFKNRTRSGDRRLEVQIDDALAQMAGPMGFRIGSGLAERIVYRDLLCYGLTYLDLDRIPGLGRRRSEIERQIVDMLALPGLPIERTPAVRSGRRAMMTASASANYVTAVSRHMNDDG